MNEQEVYTFTEHIRENLYASLNTRFTEIMETDLFLIATALYPNFGLYPFPSNMRDDVKKRLRLQVSYLKNTNRVSS